MRQPSDFLAGGGEMGELMRSLDWSRTAVGTPDKWPQSLRTATRILLNTRHPMYIFWGETATCLYNDAYRQSIGAERHPGSLGRPAREVWDEIWDVIGPQIDQVSTGKGATWHENQLVPITRNGVRDDVYWTYGYSPIDDESAPHGVGGVLVVCTETTAQVESAKKLAESDERLRLALSGGRGIGTWDWDVKNDRVVANEQFANLYGVDPEAARAGAPVATFFTAIHPEDLPRVQASIAQAVRTGDLFSEEYRLVQPGRKDCWVLAEGRCKLAPDGTPLRFPGASFDITERRQGEAELRETEERLRLATENAEIGFWDVDPINDVLVWPARTKQLFGISSNASVTMKDFFDGLHPDDRAATSAAYMAAADPAVRALYDVEYRTIGKDDGLIRWVAAKGRGTFDLQGRCVRVAGTAIDITARKRAQEELRELNETLEARVVDRTEQLEAAHAQLRQSQKLESMGSLTGGVAHDFNNLLTPIVGALDMLQRKQLGGEREQRLISGAAQSAERAKILVQRLLAFARRQPLQPIAVDLSQLVNNMAELVASTTGPQIKVVVEIADDLPAAIADPNQLEMALLNLSVNARDAMPAGGTLRITVTAKTSADAERAGVKRGDYVCLSVADTGAGMDAITLSRAIEPFFSTKGVGKGTGLGLSMAHGLALQLGGALLIKSKTGLGTNVELWLPQTDRATEQAAIAHERHLTPARGTALVVDDEELVRMSTADMLSELGYEVVEAASAEEAIRAIENGLQADLVVTDHLMPGMPGTELVWALRERHPGLPVLIISGYADVDGIAAELPRLTKPFIHAELAEALAALLPPTRALPTEMKHEVSE